MAKPNTPPTTDRLPQERKSKNQHRFTFRTVAGTVIEVPAQGFAPLPVLVALRALTGVEGDEALGMLHLIYDIADTAEGRTGLEKLGYVELQRFLKLWRRQAEATSGKSQGSAAS